MMTPETAMRQAAMTAEEYARRGNKVFEDLFPSGDARARAIFLAAFMQTAAADFHTAMIGERISEPDFFGVAVR